MTTLAIDDVAADGVHQPIFPFKRYQRAVITDPARLIGWLKSRQVGGSTTTTAKIVLDAVENAQSWKTMSRSQRQAESLLAKAAKHTLAINEYVTRVLGQPPIVDPERISLQRIPYLKLIGNLIPRGAAAWPRGWGVLDLVAGLRSGSWSSDGSLIRPANHQGVPEDSAPISGNTQLRHVTS